MTQRLRINILASYLAQYFYIKALFHYITILTLIDVVLAVKHLHDF